MLASNTPGTPATLENVQWLPAGSGRSAEKEEGDATTEDLFSKEEYDAFEAKINELENDEWRSFYKEFGNKETCLSRFLTAREGNLENAVDMIVNTFKYRKDMGVDTILDCKDDPERLAMLKRLRQYWTAVFYGLTHDGSPIQYHRLEHLRPDTLMDEKIAGEDRLRVFYLWWMETSVSLQRVAHKKHGHTGRMPQGIEIFDLKNISFWTLSGAISGLRMFSRALSVGQDHYPENLRKAFVLNAPSVITVLWSACLYVLSERTQSKISLSGGENREELAEFIDDATMNAMFKSADSFAPREGDQSEEESIAHVVDEQHDDDMD